jgi:alkylation response protein AidB-like acyl-CoA dehydrogenase
MISFALTDEQSSARDAMQGFANEALRPVARDYDEASAIPNDFFQQAWELGLTATQIPESYGGYGADRSPVTNAIVIEELAYGDATLAIAATAPSLFANAVADQGTEEQKRAYLPAFCGESFHVGSLAINESTAGFDPFAPKTTAEKKGSGYSLHGVKSFVPLGETASHFLVVARESDRLGAFIVSRDAPGLTVTEVEKNLGLKALHTNGLRLDGVDVAADQRLGGAAGADVARIINQGRVAIAAILTGLSRAVLDYCVPYSKERVAFDEPIARKQSIAFRLAEMHMEIESQRWLTWHAATDLENGRDATRNSTIAKRYSGAKAMWIADNGVQVLGGHGFIREHPVEMWYRNARTLGVLEGTASV